MRKNRNFVPANRIWTDTEDTYISERYPHDGAAGVAAVIGKSPLQVRSRANVLKVTLTPEARKRLVGRLNVSRMTNNNPMKRADVREKVRQWALTTPEGQAQYAKMMQGQHRIQKDKPTGLERRFAAMLTDLGIPFEPYFFIKPKFIVDFKIGALILEADGDWWHGHPRFSPLNPRQIAQQKRDAVRNAYLAACGYTVVRIWESELTPELLKRVLSTHQAAASADRVENSI